MRLKSPKTPGEIIPVTFDFSKILSAIDSVVIEVSVRKGTDADPSALLFSSAVIDGTYVSQIIQSGLDGVIYRIKATTNTGSFKYEEVAYLTVQENN